MVITCIVKGCDNKEKVYGAVMFHRIPTHHIQRRAWLAALNKNPKTPLMTLKKWRVCSEHFTPEDYTCTGTRLKDEATPTIFKSLTQQSGSSPNAFANSTGGKSHVGSIDGNEREEERERGPHFTPEDYTCTGTRLKDEATPTIFKSLTQQSGSSPNAFANSTGGKSHVGSIDGNEREEERERGPCVMLALATEHHQTNSESNVNIQINTILTRLDMLHDEHFVKIHFEGYISCVNFVYAV
ncbi:THAP domain-containing protein 1 [Anabarilius grahami]|uniref:THAP domain-containing protein 1 n=1 Tax=Anabarilius grahami TaxID=495550 RepID=A0A3N0XVG2_ANAGA|nr:THAP domain-containing protein 1 [Anabarilius grahami]